MNRTNATNIGEGATIAGLLHDYMVREGATEVELAELLAVDQTQVGRWRRGQTVPRPAAMAALAELLGVDAGQLEGARVESERVAAEVKARKQNSPEADVEKLRAELKAANARIKRLERKLGEESGR